MGAGGAPQGPRRLPSRAASSRGPPGHPGHPAGPSTGHTDAARNTQHHAGSGPSGQPPIGATSHTTTGESPANPGLRGHSTRAAGRNLCSLPATDALHPLKWFTKAKQRPFMTPALDMKVIFQRLYIKRRCSHTHWSFRKLPAEPGAAMEVCSPHTQPLNVQPHPWQNHGLSLPDFKGME